MIRMKGHCCVCTNGKMVFSERDDTGAVVAECLECMTGYDDPRDLASSETFGVEIVGTRAATQESVETAGLTALVVYQPA